MFLPRPVPSAAFVSRKPEKWVRIEDLKESTLGEMGAAVESGGYFLTLCGVSCSRT